MEHQIYEKLSNSIEKISDILNEEEINYIKQVTKKEIKELPELIPLTENELKLVECYKNLQHDKKTFVYNIRIRYIKDNVKHDWEYYDSKCACIEKIGLYRNALDDFTTEKIYTTKKTVFVIQEIQKCNRKVYKMLASKRTPEQMELLGDQIYS